MHNVSGIMMFSNRIFLVLLQLQIDSQVEDVIRIETFRSQTFSKPVHKEWRYCTSMAQSNTYQLVVRVPKVICEIFLTQ